MTLIIDTDPAIGVPFRDVDDGLAILLAMDNTDIAGLTINFGNVNVDKGIEVAREVLDVAGKSDIPVIRGAENNQRLGKETRASKFIINTVKEHPGEVSILAIAPLTNLATAIQHYEELLDDLEELVVMGGSLDFKPMNYFGEFNFHSDPKAAEIVLSQEQEKSIVTMDVCSQVAITISEMEELQSHEGEISSYIVDNIWLWLGINKLLTFKGFYPWDVVACAFLLKKSIFETEKCDLKIQTQGLRKGRITRKKGEKIILPTTIKGEEFKKFFLSSIKSL